MRITQTTYGQLKFGDIFFFATSDADAPLRVKTDYWTQHVHDDSIVYLVTVETDER